MPSILVVDDDREMRAALKEAISRYGYGVEVAGSVSEASVLLKDREISLVITDMRMPRMSGIDLIKRVRRHSTTLPILVITGFGTVENAVECMKLGASDYLMKPFSFDALRQAIERIISPGDDEEIITRDEEMKRILRIACEVAKTDATILITGESGTGKELLARYIHRHSFRKERSFVAVNCAAIPENLLESELFGHEKGSFTGALERKTGKFELSNGGTLLLDEIGDMPLSLQAKLLRVLQEKEVDRIGGKEPIPVDIRVVATTNRDLGEAVNSGEFREDLYYRLSVFPIELPPLRDRSGDIALLSEHFLRKYASAYGREIAGFTDDAYGYLCSQPWRGNVRELDNVIQRAVLLCRSEKIKREDLLIGKGSAGSGSGPMTIREMERELILQTLKATNNNRTRAAERLGITVRTLRNKLNEYRLEEKISPSPGKAQACRAERDRAPAP